jgi:hypothetical protein
MGIDQRLFSECGVVELSKELVSIIIDYVRVPLLVVDGLVTGQRWWELKGRIFYAQTVHINHMGDIHPFRHGPRFYCDEVEFLHCDKNFIYYWNKPLYFCGVHTIIFSDPPLLNYWYEPGQVCFVMSSREPRHDCCKGKYIPHYFGAYE